MLKSIDTKIDSITMYRLLLYYLVSLLLIAMGLSIFGDLHYNPFYIAISAIVVTVACFIINIIFAAIFEAPINNESSLITGLILSLIIPPNPTGYGFLFLLAAAGLAIASKYILAINKKHIFNPAAIAVVLTAFGPHQSASWWVGTATLFPFVLLGGIIITRKIRRGKMVIAFMASTTLATVVYSVLTHTGVIVSLENMALSSAVPFLGFVMLTEPLTSPPTVNKQVWYASLVGILLPPQVHIFSLYSSPELALVAGNAFSYLISPKTKLFPVLKQRLQVAVNTLDFIFDPGSRFSYEPGQYIEVTLPHLKADSRGSRRYFTLASSPTEADIRFGVRFYPNGSSFKQALIDMDQTTPVAASQVAGEFVLPRKQATKMVFIAGGIGITPFRSMTKYLIDKSEQRTITLLYAARTRADVAYRDIFEEAKQKLGMKTVYVYSDEAAAPGEVNALSGLITAPMIAEQVPDYLERVFYISGTHPMVVSIQNILLGLGVSKKSIKIDFFPGYA